MKSSEDRRTPNVVRVSHTALVDICSLEEEGSPFQGQSCNISGRGMHVRGSYLPEIGESLVCRFNHEEEEILVEGKVAWRAEGEDSGEFGIQFTALDAGSAELLRGLGQPKVSAPSLMPTTLSLHDDDEDDEHPELEAGERVRLHIDGLGAPMKASVHDSSSRKVKVGSALEFLKMGHSVELEEIVGGQRRGAKVDSVNVVIHPTTSVPELVVQLRYEGVSPTPPPARAIPNKGAKAGTLPSFDEDEHDVLDSEDDEGHVLQPAAEAIAARLGGAMSSASSAAQKAGGLISQFAQSAKERMPAVGASKPARKTTQRPTRGSLASEMPKGVRRRPQTSLRPSQKTPSHLRSGIHDLNIARGATRKRSAPSNAQETKGPVRGQSASRKVRASVVALSALVLFGGSAVALRKLGPDAGPALAQVKASETVPESQKPSAAAAQSKSASRARDEEEEKGVIAEVPLFGPQAVATTSETAPKSKVSDAEAERRAAAAAVRDQSFDEPPEVEEAKKDKPWGRGRLYLPTIHRIRLDGAGASLSGAINSDGFTVVVPGRKVMESGKAIQKRDKRIVAVKADNEGPNAKVRFEFRGPVPPYRVRLRQDFIEFLISAPEESVARL